tara:strand:+ start:9546 stop:10208 length:663 start_codon:yes stop_codon:yes gene_type:complete
MANDIPTDDVLALKQQGVVNSEIIEQLKNKGFSYEQISDALTQAEMKSQVEGAPPAPSAGNEQDNMQPSMMNAPIEPPMQQVIQPEPMSRPLPQFSRPMAAPTMMAPMASSRETDERIEEIAESIINEKWQKMVEDVGDMNVWKEKVRTNIASMKQEILRVENRFESLQKVIVSKVNDYDKNISDVGSEIKALEKLLQKIIEPLTNNVNELSRITDRLKK